MSSSLQGKVILITGASAGIGAEAARQLAVRGAHLLLLARRAAALSALRDEVVALGGRADCYPVDLSDGAALDACATAVLEEHHQIDVVVNNAGRSIRRPLLESVGRIHDFERTIALNYLAAVRLTLPLLPRMRQCGHGQIINVSSVAPLMTTPRFAAYLASKAALDAFTRSLRIELAEHGIVATGVHFPLVKTDMIAPTAIYRYLPLMEVAEAASWIVKAIDERPARIAPPFATALQLATTALPGPALRALGRFYKRRLAIAQERMARDEARGAPEGQELR